VAFLPWGTIWPWLVWDRSPQLFHDWFWDNNIGRFIDSSTVIGSKNNMLFCLRTVSWFTLPALPIAIWMWKERWSDRRTDPVFQVTLVSFLVMCVVFSVSRQARTIYASPMVVPVVLAAGAFVHRLNGRPAKIADGIVTVIYLVAVTLAWGVWLVVVLGRPDALMERLARVAPGYTPELVWSAFVPAVLLTVGYLAWLRLRDRENGHSAILNWSSGMLLVYSLGMTLYLPFANVRMGYRDVFIPLREHLPVSPGPVASYGIGESERALLHYLAGLKTLRTEVHDDALDTCQWLIIQGDYEDNVRMGPPERGDWDLVYEGRRGESDSYRLYRRRDG